MCSRANPEVMFVQGCKVLGCKLARKSRNEFIQISMWTWKLPVHRRPSGNYSPGPQSWDQTGKQNAGMSVLMKFVAGGLALMFGKHLFQGGHYLITVFQSKTFAAGVIECLEACRAGDLLSTMPTTSSSKSSARHDMSVVLVTGSYDHEIRFWEAWSGICSRTIARTGESGVNSTMPLLF